MISYKPMYDTMYEKDITEYALIYKHGLSANTIYRIKQGKPITTKTIDILCFILDCQINNIITYIKE